MNTKQGDTLRDFFMQAPAIMAILQGPEHVFELANPDYLNLVGNRDVIGKTVRQALPELEGQGFYELLDRVYSTGESFNGKEMPVEIDTGKGLEQIYVDLHYQAFRNQQGQISGVLVFAYDVTEQVLARQAIEENRNKYKVLFESMDQGFCIIEVLFDDNKKPIDWRFLEVNPAFEKHNGLSKATGKTIRELTPRIEPYWFDIYGKVALTGQPTRIVEGSEALGRWFDIYAFRINESTCCQVAVLFTDVSERKKTELVLKESEQQFVSLAENIPQLAWMADESGYIFWYNKRWYAYTGTTPEQMEGWGWQSVHDPKVLPRVLERWKKSIESGSPFEMVFPLKGADGNFSQFLTRVIPLRNNAGKIIRWFGTNTDITEQKKTEEALRLSEERLKQSYEDLETKIAFRNLELERLKKEHLNRIAELENQVAELESKKGL